jgi:hypothetical protein
MATQAFQGIAFATHGFERLFRDAGKQRMADMAFLAMGECAPSLPPAPYPSVCWHTQPRK